jgi:hypothetical protein
MKEKFIYAAVWLVTVALGPIYAIFTAIDVCVRVWNGERDLKGKLPRRHQDTKKKLNGFV